MKRTGRWIVGTLWPVLTVVIALAATRQDTGKVDGDRFVDRSYGFAFHKYENWKYGKIDQEDPAHPVHARFTLTQKNPQIPNERRTNQETFTTPSLGLWADTSSLSVEAFVDAVKDKKCKLKWRKDLATQFPLIDKGHFEEQAQIQIGGQGGIVLQYRLPYEAQLYDRATDRYSMIEESLLGDAYIVKDHGRVYVFYFRAERPSYRTVREEVRGMILTMEFTPAADSTKSSGN
ncbi:MAG: hypothetical protein HY304_04665 [candidate division Zixibacteria bacterium]|nr:hypothetical protein [candidate division Zixibacteria bacterium]